MRVWRISAILAAGALLVGALGLIGCSGEKAGEPKSSDSTKGTEPVGGTGGTGEAPPNASNANPGEPGAANPGVGSTDPSPVPEGMVKVPDLDVKIPKEGTGQWTRSAVKASELAPKVAKAVAAMKATEGSARCYIKTPEGQAQALKSYKIQDSKHFRLEYLQMEGIPRQGFLLADGKNKTKIVIGSKAEVVGVNANFPGSKLSAEEIFKRWPRDFMRLMLLPLSDGIDSWSIVLSKLEKGEGGFKTQIEQRLMEYRGRFFTSYRVLAKRQPNVAKTAGECEIEMVIDAQRFLPVTVRVISTDSEGGRWDQQWSANWTFQKKFKLEEFQSIGGSNPSKKGA